MISYSQNFEDVMLWRALKHVNNGFYVDVGAWSPDFDSVTRHFYENGWRGINIEPNPSIFELYPEKRPEDINLQTAVSNESGTTNIYFSENSGLSSLDKNVVGADEGDGIKNQSEEVEVTTLANIFKEHAMDQAIHFLKVDVEGLEKNVLLGNDWQQFRPWIVLVEATKPMSQIENHDEWEYILTENDYFFAYADGLNRFYVSKEQVELKEKLKYPPNVFDQFTLHGQVASEKRANDLEAKLREAIRQQLMLEHSIEEIFETPSWKATKPLRAFIKFKDWFVNNVKAWMVLKPQSRPHRVLMRILTGTKGFLTKHPKLKELAIKVLLSYPMIATKIENFMDDSEEQEHMYTFPMYPEQLNQQGQLILKQLSQDTLKD